MENIHDSLYGKTSPEFFHQTKAMILELCLRKSLKPKFLYLNANGHKQEWLPVNNVMSHGEHLTLNIGEYPNVEKESFLSQILQKETDVPNKYYLTKKGCEGILRRAKERNRKLPIDLEKALIRQVGEA